MPERNAEFLEILIGQMTQDRDIDIVLGKAFSVRGHAERFKPICYVLVGGHRLPRLFAP